jgi:molybdopterin-synthase adenylyltransferase
LSQNLTEDQIYRYSRNILLPEIGGTGQQKLLKSKVFCVGLGGLGSPIGLYLAAAGIGTIGIADSDNVDISNLQRQVLHYTDDVGKLKTSSAYEKLKKLNPEINIIEYSESINKNNIRRIIREYDIIVDGSDNFSTRYLVNDACFFEKKTLVSGAILRFEGQVSVFNPHVGSPCYRCLYPEIPPSGMIPTCQEAGILGSVAGIVGSIQAVETIKEILQIGKRLVGKLLVIDAFNMEISRFNIQKYSDCILCGTKPEIKRIIQYKPDDC